MEKIIELVSKEIICEGNCIVTHGQHKGDVVRVVVECWGEFNYCENAIDEDNDRGLTVKKINEQ